MKVYKRRKSICIDRHILFASAITVSGVALLILCCARFIRRGSMTDLFKNVFTKIVSHLKECGEEIDVIFEEDTGDSNEI